VTLRPCASGADSAITSRIQIQGAGKYMVFFSASLGGLIQWCRAFHHGIAAGLSLVRVYRIQSKKGPRGLRDMAERIAERLEKGETLEDSLEVEGDRLPTLFRELSAVGERTGHLPEIYEELAEYYEMQQTLGRQFRSQITWPVLQFIGAVVVIAFLIFILGMIGDARGGEPVAPIGFGLTGASGAIAFLLAVATFLGVLFAIYLLITRGLRQRGAFEAFLLRLPAIGKCTEAFAMGRFCIALRMTLETGMSTPEALQQSLRATGNAAFTRCEDPVVALIKAGKEISVAVRACPAFSDEFIEILNVAEITGQIPEVMIRQAEHYREEASRRLKDLTRYAGWSVYAFVGLLMVLAIFKIAGTYLGAINHAAG
jgi:type IV pilus assembly protein PilC